MVILMNSISLSRPRDPRREIIFPPPPPEELDLRLKEHQPGLVVFCLESSRRTRRLVLFQRGLDWHQQEEVLEKTFFF